MLRRALVAAAYAALALGCAEERPIFSGPSWQGDPPNLGPLGGLIVTSNSGDDTASVVDPTRIETRWNVPIGFIPVELEGPHHVVADPMGRAIYFNLSEAVVCSGSGPHGAHGTGTVPGYALRLDTQDSTMVGFAMVDPNPGDNTLSPDGKVLYVTHYDLLAWTRGVQSGDIRKGDSALAIVDTATMTVRKKVPICPAAHGVRTSHDGKELYATCGPDEIAVVDLTQETPSVRRVLLTPTSVESSSCDHCPYALGVAPDGTVWVSTLGLNGGGMGGGDVRVYDPRTGTFDPTKTISLCGRAVFADFKGTPERYEVFVPEQGSCGDWLRRYDVIAGAPAAPTGALQLSRGDCFAVHMVQVAPGGSTAYLVCEGEHAACSDRQGPGSLVVLDLATLTPTPRGVARTGIFPDGMAIVPALQ